MDGFVRERVRKLFMRLGLRGRHPHPPAPSPASGRGGEARVVGRCLGQRARGRRARLRAGDLRYFTW